MLLLAGAAFLYHETRGITFRGDEWSWILFRRGNDADTFLRPHNEHFQLVPIAIYKLLFATVGLHDYAPYRAVGVAAHLGCVALLFVYARRRAGDFIALLAAALLLFFGAGWENIFWPFQFAWLITLAAGLGALLMLDRRDQIGDLTACGLLLIALASSGVGLAIAVGLAVEVLWRRPRRDAWIVLVPAGLYALWWLSYQNSLFGTLNGVKAGGSGRVGHSLLLALGEVAQAAAGTFAGLVGLAGEIVPDRTGTLLTWGPVLVGVALAALVWRRARLGPFPPRVLTLLATLVSFWLLIALSGRYLVSASVLASRYLYAGGLLTLLVLVELARGITPGLRVKVGLTVVVAAAILSNVGILRDAGRYLRGEAHVTKAELGALELARPVVKPHQAFDPRLAWYLTAVRYYVNDYFAAERAYGSPAASPGELATEPEDARVAVDRELIRTYGIGLQPNRGGARLGTQPVVDSVTGGTVLRRGPCVTFNRASFVRSNQTPRVGVTIPYAGLAITAAGGQASIGLRRFADEFQPLGSLSPPVRSYLRIRPDAARPPWHMTVAPAGSATLCGLR